MVTFLVGEAAQKVFDRLMVHGFRRVGQMVYLPMCETCTECVPVRIRVAEFTPRRCFRRTLAAFAHLTVEAPSAHATKEQYDLFSAYQQGRHPGGDMARMTWGEYVGMMERSPVNTRLVEYRQDGVLVGACLTDEGAPGLSLVYSFFRPEPAFTGLGTFMILDRIAAAREAGLPHVYLGFYIRDCRKMQYKNRFQPMDALTPEGWIPFWGGDVQPVSGPDGEPVSASRFRFAPRGD